MHEQQYEHEEVVEQVEGPEEEYTQVAESPDWNVAEPRKRRFLRALADIPVLGEACKVADVGRTTVWRWRQEDLLFAAAYEQAEQAGIDGLEAEAMRRGREKSDLLLITVLNAKRSDQYRHRGTVELTGRDGGPLEILNMTPEQRRARIAELAAKLGYERKLDSDK